MAARAASGGDQHSGVRAEGVLRLGFWRYRRVFGSLPAPSAPPRPGDYHAEFVGPFWLRWSAQPSLALTALAGWCGKRFTATGAVNLVARRGAPTLREALPMQPRVEPSSVDGQPAVRMHYARTSGVPWRWTIDELRPLADGSWLGLMHLELPLLRHLHFPFLLRPPRA
jgi:hypothetical protein